VISLSTLSKISTKSILFYHFHNPCGHLVGGLAALVNQRLPERVLALPLCQSPLPGDDPFRSVRIVDSAPDEELLRTRLWT
jgi:hypothetical protein